MATPQGEDVHGDFHDETGTAVYAPELMLKVWLYAYALGVTSARRLEQRIREDLAFLYLAGGATPDNWALSAFRRRHSRGINDVFTRVLEGAQRVGMIRLGHVAIDSTRLRGAASRERMDSETKLRRERVRLRRQIRGWKKDCNAEDQPELPGEAGARERRHRFFLAGEFVRAAGARDRWLCAGRQSEL